jgi:hypothetical protein
MAPGEDLLGADSRGAEQAVETQPALAAMCRG